MSGPAAAAELRKRIDDRTLVVGVLGLGYVGLPLALAFAEKRVSVVGFDVDPEKIEALSAGRNYIKHLDGRRLTAAAVLGPLPRDLGFRRAGRSRTCC